MKKSILCSLFCLLQVYSFSQVESANEKSGIWKFFSVEAGFGVSTFQNRPSRETRPELFDHLDTSYTHQSGMDVNIGLNYHFKPNFSFQTGIGYNQSTEDFSYTQYNLFCGVSDVIATIDSTTMDTIYIIVCYEDDPSNTTTSTERNFYTLLTIPFQFAYEKQFGSHGGIEFALGGSLSIYGRNQGTVVVHEQDYRIGAEKAYRTKGLLSLGGSIKYLHRFGDHHSIYVEPWTQFGLTNQSRAPLSYESKRHRYGVRFGYRFYF